MKRKRRLSVTVAAVVHNKQDRISRFIQSVLTQKYENIRLKKIVLFSDGSKDKTVDEVKKLNLKKIELIAGKKKLGRAKRLNEIFKTTTSDILILLDADTVLKDELVLESLSEPFRQNKNIALVGGNPKPLPPNTFFENVAQNSFEARELLKRTVNEGKNIYGASKHILAMSNSFVKKLRIPSSIENDDIFLYLKCIDNNFEFAHQEQAVVWFRLPTTIRDQFANIKKTTEEKTLLYKRFSNDLISQELDINYSLKAKTFVYQFVNNPVGFASLIPLSTYSLIKNTMRKSPSSFIKKMQPPKIQISFS